MDMRKWLGFAAITVLVALPLTLVACGPGGEEAPAPSGEEAAPAPAPAPAGGEAAAEVGAGYAEIAALQEGDATITGTVTYVGQVPNLPPIAMDADPTCVEKHGGQPVPSEALVLGDGNTMANVFVQVKDTFAQGDYPVPSTPVVIDQLGCLYHPHVVGMLAGQELQFVNSDGILHNVHGTPKDNREFNVGMPGNPQPHSVTLNQPELYVPVKCDVHPWMSAYVGVMTHPYFQVTDDGGTFSIHVPAGTYTIEAWHEKLGTRDQEVTVGAGETATVDFQFDVPKQ